MSNATIFPALCRACGIPEPVAEFMFAAPSRRWRFDWAWIEQRVALEVEGGVWTRGRHQRPRGFLADISKYNEAAILGWLVLRCTPAEMSTGAAVELVRRAMETKR